MVNWGSGAKGAAGGAAAGAAFGPYGAAIGGAAGGLIGLFSGDDNGSSTLSDYQKQVLSRGIPQIGAGDTGQAATSGFRNNQALLIGRLEDMAAGRGPSLAAEQMKAATDRNIAQQYGLAQSGRGNATLANIVAANNIGSLGAQASQQSMLGRLGEQQLALSQLGGVIQGARATDEQTAQFNAQQQNFIAEANLTAKLKALGLSDDAIQSIIAAQQKQATLPTTGDQLLAGGTSIGALAGSMRGQRSGGIGFGAVNAYNPGNSGFTGDSSTWGA